MSATLSDIAKATGTSISTVSRVLTNAPAAGRISRATRDRISVAARELGYRPNLLARSLRTRKTYTAAVMVSDIANPWFGSLASLIEQSLHAQGYSLVVCNSGEDADLEAEYLRLLPQKGIDGLIIVPLATQLDALMAHLPADLPLVVLDRPIEGVPASITTDQRQAAGLLCDELARKGVRRVGLIRGPEHIITHRIRAKVIRSRFEVLADHTGPAQRQTGAEAWQQMREAGLDAVLCTNNFLGQGAIEAMSDREPRPIIGCFDEIPLMNLLPLPIVCCVQDVSELARIAVDMLLKLIDDQQPVEPATIPARTIANEAFTRLSDR